MVKTQYYFLFTIVSSIHENLLSKRHQTWFEKLHFTIKWSHLNIDNYWQWMVTKCAAKCFEKEKPQNVDYCMAIFMFRLLATIFFNLILILIYWQLLNCKFLVLKLQLRGGTFENSFWVVTGNEKTYLV